MSDLGWVKVHRKILENPLFKNPKLFTLWVYLLLRANHSDGKAMIGNQVVPIKRGQFLTGRKKLSEALDIPESTLERLLSVLESERQIGQQKLNKFRLISITNYDLYQDSDNKWTTSGQQVDTNKNVKNEKNDKNEKKPNIPYDEFADYYNRHFAIPSGNSKLVKLTDTRKALIKKAWYFDTTSEDEKTHTNNLGYWERYFDYLANVPFFRADFERHGEHKNWKPDFEFVIKEKTILKTKEKAY